MSTFLNPPEKEAPKLRAFCARNNISQTDIAKDMGVDRSYISKVLRADKTKKSVSGKQLDKVWNSVLHIARKQE